MKILLYLWLVLVSFSLSAQKNDALWQELDNIPVKVNELVHDFGKVKQFSKLKVKFTVLNDSIHPFIIKDVTTSCGCTTSAFTKNPIAQGKQGAVKLEFNASKSGVFSKSAFIYHTFGFKSIKLEIKGEVIPKIKKSVKIGNANPNDKAAR